MNKKLIAIAIATALTAPAAMADIKISGIVGGHFTLSDKNANLKTTADQTKSSREFADAGFTRLVFDGTSGNSYARIALDKRLGRDVHTHTADVNIVAVPFTGTVTSDPTSAYASINRDQYIGHKFGKSSFQFGRMAGAAKNLEKDPLIATFLQSRGTAAEALAGGGKFGSSSFIDSLIQYKTKAGGMTIIAQYDPTDNTSTTNSGHIGVSAKGKAGAVTYWVSYNNGAANVTGGASSNQVNAKIGASMKLGSVKLTVNMADSQNGSGGNKTTGTMVLANMGLGNGLSVDVGYAGNGDRGTWLRAGVIKKLSAGANAYAGLVSTTPPGGGTGVTTMGAGMTVKF